MIYTLFKRILIPSCFCNEIKNKYYVLLLLDFAYSETFKDYKI